MAQRSLSTIDVATPCSARWEDMKGDERSRFCEQCQLRVFNVSGMKRAEAERFLAASVGATCVRFFRRADGTILTEDCPVGLATRAKRTIRRAAVAITGILGLGVIGGFIERALREERRVTMGDMCPVSPPPTPTSAAATTSGSGTGSAPVDSSTEGSEK